MNAHPTDALVFVALGSPNTSDAHGVRAFLRRFLSDTRVVELPRLLWLPILYLFILPLRPRRLVPLYRQIWTDTGSPLLKITTAISNATRKALPPECNLHVSYAMCYSDPDIAQVMDELMSLGMRRIFLLPLYPQYSATTSAAVFDQYARWANQRRVLPELIMARDYHDHPTYINAMAARIRAHWQKFGKAEKLLLSFHGLPERCIALGDPYKEQCTQSARLLVELLGLKNSEWQLAFQSRFGKAPWIKPATDEILRTWGQSGLASVDVFCPGFATDCLETLEEIDIQNRQLFEQQGGGDYRYIPCLNDSAEHIQLFVELARDMNLGARQSN